MPDYNRLIRSRVSKDMTAEQRAATYNDLRTRVQWEFNNKPMQAKIAALLELGNAIQWHERLASLREATYALNPNLKEQELHVYLSKEKIHDLVALSEKEFV